MAPGWTLSVVSHGHGASVTRLLADCAAVLDPAAFELVVTANRAEDEIDARAWSGALQLIRNPAPAGFAANHNAALARAGRRWFATIDPDLRLRADPFPALAATLEAGALRLAAPCVVDGAGRLQDNARPRVSPLALLRRHVLRRDDAPPPGGGPQPVDWIAGLFIAGARDTFAALGGFDPGYHMYCEDADLGLRCWNAGGSVWVVPAPGVVHDARRRTLKDATHLRWHLQSLLRLWRSAAYRDFRRAKG